jgi:radical SAM protein with 4Fe4S-binding SPASM domain
MREAAGLGAVYGKFTGGEPLLYQDFGEVYSEAHRLFPEVCVETNGTLAPRGIFRLFRERPPFQVSVSLDSADPEVHDRFRGQRGAWKSTVEFITRLGNEAGVFPQVIMSLSSPDREAVRAMVSFLTGRAVSSLKINLVSPVGGGTGAYFGRREEFGECVSFLEWAFAEFPEGVEPDAPPAFIPVNRLKGSGRCWVGNLLGVLPDGTVSFCGIAYSRPELSMGAYPGVSLGEVWRNSPLLHDLRRSLETPPEGICSECVHWRSCRGKCVMENYAVGGCFSAPHLFCRTARETGLFPVGRLHG